MKLYERRQDGSASSDHRFREEDYLKGLLLEFLVERDVAVPAQAWNRARIERSSHGKPLLRWEGQPVHFSISHSGPWWVCAVDFKPIGIDIEYPAKHGRYRGKDGAAKLHAIANRFFTLEEKAFLLDAEDQFSTFFEIWVRKEAYLKYLGLGLSYGLPRFSVVDQDSFLEVLKDPQGAYARLSGLELDPELTAAICRHPNT